MSVNIINLNSKAYTLTVKELTDGKAYEDQMGDIYIANKTNDIRAFSICGNYIADSYTPGYFREVNLNITVEN
jgi:hypothetical protein